MSLPLTPRQRQILDLLRAGHSTHEIAQRLSIAESTAANHRMDVMRRLGARSYAQLLVRTHKST